MQVSTFAPNYVNDDRALLSANCCKIKNRGIPCGSRGQNLNQKQLKRLRLRPQDTPRQKPELPPAPIISVKVKIHLIVKNSSC